GDVETHAFVWTQSGGMVDLGSLGGTFSQAIAVNKNGMVIGSSAIPGDPMRNAVLDTHAFVWTQARGLVDLGTLGGSTSSASAMNDQGVVVGSSTTSGNAQTHAFVWTQTAGMVDLGAVEVGDSSAFALNSNGLVVGASNNRATLWNLTTGATPTIAWATPSDIVYGTALGVTQLNATADVPGTFTYSPAEGPVTRAGDAQTL